MQIKTCEGINQKKSLVIGVKNRFEGNYFDDSNPTRREYVKTQRTKSGTFHKILQKFVCCKKYLVQREKNIKKFPY